MTLWVFCPPPPAEPCPSLDNPLPCVTSKPFRVPTRPHPQKPPRSLSLVSECPLPHTLGCPVSKNQPPHSARPLQFSPSDQYTGTRPPSTGKSYWDQDKEAGFFCPFPGSLLLPDWAAHLILRKPVSLPWTSDVMFCEREISSILRCHTIFESKGHMGK